VLIFAVFAPLITPYQPQQLSADDRLQSPSWTHVFGTDNFGRDIFTRVVFGARTSLIGSAGVVLFSVAIGIGLGVIAAYFKRVDIAVMRVVDVLMAFPPLLLALVLVSILGRGMLNVIVAVGVTHLTRTTRIVYGLALKIREEPYVEATVAAGARSSRVILRHIIPNLLSPLIVQSTFIFAFSMLEMAALDFLGLGLPPQIPSWGGMLNEGRLYITVAPWLLLFPGGFIVITVLSLNLAGDVLRDQLDPHFRDSIQGV
jgi:peptide/nickel transport system permease protein